jgi:cytochrome c biogenesis protein CcdA
LYFNLHKNYCKGVNNKDNKKLRIWRATIMKKKVKAKPSNNETILEDTLNIMREFRRISKGLMFFFMGSAIVYTIFGIVFVSILKLDYYQPMLSSQVVASTVFAFTAALLEVISDKVLQAHDKKASTKNDSINTLNEE